MTSAAALRTGVAEHLRVGITYTIEKHSEGVWLLRPEDKPDGHAAIRAGAEVLLSNIPPELQQKLALKSNEKAKVVLSENRDEFLTLQIERKVSLNDLAGAGVTLKRDVK